MAYPFLLSPKTQEPQLADAGVYTLKAGPQFGHRLAMACRRLTWDLVDADVAFEGTISTHNNVNTTQSAGTRMGKRRQPFGPGSNALHSWVAGLPGGGAVHKRLAPETSLASLSTAVGNVTLEQS